MFRLTGNPTAHPSRRQVLPAALTLLSLAAVPLPMAGAAGHPVEPAPAAHGRIASHRIQADRNGNKLFDNLEAALAGADKAARLEVIVRYRPGSNPATTPLGPRAYRRFTADRSLLVRLTPDEIRQQAASPDVVSIEANPICYTTREAAGSDFGTTQARMELGYSGDADGDPEVFSPQDLTIAVIDTGIDGNHPDFAGGRIIGWKDFVNNRPEPYDDDGHGTHCASIAAGVAPGASLVGVKVMKATPNRPASAPADRIARAIDWCVENREQYGIDVLNLSLGDGSSSSGQDLLSRAVDRASAAGLVVCISAGNSGPDLYSIGSPAAAASAITVGNMRDVARGGFALESHSSRGPTSDGRIKPDLCAPGVAILAAAANTGGYRRATGTSMAAPFVAGVVALMRAANPGLGPEEVKRILKETAVHFGPEGENPDYGAGRVNGYAAVAAAAGQTGTGPEGPAHLFAAGSLADSGDVQSWVLPVEDTRYPVAITLLMPTNRLDFDLYVFDPQGRAVAESTLFVRQETILLQPAVAGEYQVRVRSFGGSGPYWLDASAGTGTTSNRLHLWGSLPRGE